jgi:hypothetical protein
MAWLFLAAVLGVLLTLAMYAAIAAVAQRIKDRRQCRSRQLTRMKPNRIRLQAKAQHEYAAALVEYSAALADLSAALGDELLEAHCLARAQAARGRMKNASVLLQFIGSNTLDGTSTISASRSRDKMTN